MLTPVLYFVYFLMLLISYLNISIGLEDNARRVRILYFLGIEPRLSVRQADALSAAQTMLTHVLYFLILLLLAM